MEIADGITEGGVVDGDGLAGLKLIDVDAEDHLRVRREPDLHARLCAGVVGEEQQETAVERLGAALFRKGDGELRSRWRRRFSGKEFRNDGSRKETTSMCNDQGMWLCRRHL